MKIGNNIKKYREEKGWTQAQLGKLIGVSGVAVSYWESGRSEPNMGTIEKLSELFGVTKTQLLGIADTFPSTNHSHWIPILGRVAAGIPIEMIEDIEDYEEIDDSLGECFGLVIDGDSMSPDLPKGSTVIVHKQEDVESGQIAIVCIDGNDATCKKLIKHESGITLASLNPMYEPMFFTNEEIKRTPIRILGRVIESRRKW